MLLENRRLKTELEEQKAMVENLVDRCADLEILKGQLVDYLGERRINNNTKLRKEKAKVRPQEKVIYALEELSHELAEIQNRILDQEF